MQSKQLDLFEMSMDFLGILDLEFRIVEVNSIWFKNLGWTNRDLLGQSFFKYLNVVGEDRSFFSEKFLSGEEDSLRFAIQVKSKDLSYFDVSWILKRDKEKKIYLLSGHEQTELRRTAASLTRAKQKLEALFESMVEGVIVHDHLGKVIRFNQAALNILNLQPQEILGKTSYDPDWKVVREDMSDCPREELPGAKALRTGQVQKNHFIGVIDRKHQMRWLDVTAVPLFDKDETVPYKVLITFRDVTEQRMAQIAIKQGEELLSRIINSLPALIGHWDKELKNIHANDAYADYFGKKPSEIKGRHICEVLGAELYEKNLPHIHGVLTGEKQIFEREIMLPQGGSRYTLAQYLPEVFEGKVIGFFVIVVDISKIKDLERERNELISKMVASSRMASIGEMAGGIAHEINTPLTSITLMVSELKNELMAQSYGSMKVSGTLANIEKTALRISQIIKGLRSFAVDGVNENFGNISLTEIVDLSLGLIEQRIIKKGIALHVVRDKGDFMVLVQKTLVVQAMVNLLMNAIDAVEGQGNPWIEIKVEGTDENGAPGLSVTDSGLGVPKDIQDKIMQPFFTTKKYGTGMGLGLSTSFRIMSDQGGELRYDPLSSNTKFMMIFPINKQKIASLGREN